MISQSAGAESIDVILNTINPFDEFWLIPDIGLIYGHDEAYAFGQAVGAIAGTGLNLAISVVGPGLLQCGTKGMQILKGWEIVGAAGDIATAGKHAYEGNFGWGDVLGLVSAGLSIKASNSFNCFTADMHLVEGMIERRFVIPPEPLARTDRHSHVNDAWVVLAVGMSFTTLLEFRRSRKRRVAEMSALSQIPLIPAVGPPDDDQTDRLIEDALLDDAFRHDDKRTSNSPDPSEPAEFAALDEMFASLHRVKRLKRI